MEEKPHRPPKTRLTRAEMNAVRDGARPAHDLMPFAAPDQLPWLERWARKWAASDKDAVEADLG